MDFQTTLYSGRALSYTDSEHGASAMANDTEISRLRTLLTGIEEDMEAEIRTIVEDAVQRSVAVVRRAETASAHHRSYLKVLESETGASTDSRRDGAEASAATARSEEKKAPVAAVVSRASPSEQKPGKDALTIDANGIPRRNGKLDLEAALEGIVLPPNPQSARHVMLSIVKQKGQPVPFPILDHAVIAQGMTRSAGEKSRRTMEQTGLVKRVGKRLVLTELGESTLAAIEDGSVQS